MDKIYPEKQAINTPPTLSPEEELALKKAIVLAIEKGIEHPQDRALDAVANAGLTTERQTELRTVLHLVAPLEEQVRLEGKILAAAAEKAYAEGKQDAVSLEAEIVSNLVDKTIYAKRFVEVKEGKDLTPIFPAVLGETEPIIEEKP